MTDWQALCDPDIQAFIQHNAQEDPAKLALAAWPNPTWPRTLILDQIKARQKAQKKAPEWTQTHGVIFPSPSILEQASSTATARYKASLCTGNTAIDLTGGCGIDSWALTHHFTTLHTVEHTQDAAQHLAHNLATLNPHHTTTVHHDTAEHFITHFNGHADLIYIDPQRRTTNKKGFFQFDACTPNIIELLPTLCEKANTIIIKASPMISLDACETTLPYLTDIHVVEWDKQCKEIVLILKPGTPETRPPRRHAICLNQNGMPEHSLTSHPTLDPKAPPTTYTAPLTYLYEPCAALQKAGPPLMDTLVRTYPVHKLAPDTHLFTSDTPIATFPGRSFTIHTQFPVNAKALKAAGITQANLTIRNFPSTVEALKKTLKLKDGGNTYLFACTLHNDHKTLIACRKDFFKT